MTNNILRLVEVVLIKRIHFVSVSNDDVIELNMVTVVCPFGLIYPVQFAVDQVRPTLTIELPGN